MINNNKKNHKKLISASELAQYQYCSIAWKLKKLGYIPNSKSLEIGGKKHEQYGRIIDINKNLNKKSNIFVIISILLFVIAIILLIIEVLI